MFLFLGIAEFVKNILNVNLIYFIALVLLFSACREPVVIVVPDNEAPDYRVIPAVMVQNYLNRLYIDLLGREPVQAEKAEAFAWLTGAALDTSARRELILRLQTDTTYIPGDSSYQYAYCRRMYELAKERLMEGATDELIQFRIGKLEEKAYEDSLRGDRGGVDYSREEQHKLERVLGAREAYRAGEIDHREMYGRMLQNWIYDDINKGTFNFVHAAFEDLFFRFPTEAEYEASFSVIEYNYPGTLFQQVCQDKTEYVQIMTHSKEFAEGMIRWAYLTLLAREASSTEVARQMEQFFVDHDFSRVQRSILMSDEYAHF